MRGHIQLLAKSMTLLVVVSAITLAPAQNEVSDEEYAVYSAFVDYYYQPQRFKLLKLDRVDLLFIENRTSDCMAPDVVLDDIPELKGFRPHFANPDAIRDFVNKIKRSARLHRRFKIRYKFKLISAKKTFELVREGSAPVPGVLVLSRVRFDPEGKVALLCYVHTCGNMCAESGYVVMTLRNRQWAVVKALPYLLS